MEESSESFTILRTKMSEMSHVKPFLQEKRVHLPEVAFFFDHDETFGVSVGICKGQTFKFLTCPDRYRTYKEAFSLAFKGSPYNFEFFDLQNILSLAGFEEFYEVFDKAGTTDLVTDLFSNDACFVGVCSGLPISDKKSSLMKTVGLDEQNYIHAPSSKARRICRFLSKLEQIKERVKTIILVDNSAMYGIDPFLRDIEVEAKKVGFSQLTIIGIEFTKYTDMIAEGAISEELVRLQSLLDDLQDYTSDKALSIEDSDSSIDKGGA